MPIAHTIQQLTDTVQQHAAWLAATAGKLEKLPNWTIKATINATTHSHTTARHNKIKCTKIHTRDPGAVYSSIHLTFT